MSYFFDPTSVYADGTAIVKGDLTLGDIAALQKSNTKALALNGAFGWSGVGIEHIANLHALERLDVLTSSSTAIDNVLRLPNLQRLYLGGNCHGIVDFSALPNLEVLRFNNEGKKELEFQNIDLAKSLREVHGNISAALLSNLARSPALKTIAISNSKMVDLKWLAGFNLQALMISRATQLKNLEGIETQKKLSFLRIDTCKKIQSVELLAKVISLQYLILTSCGAISSLIQLTNLKHLELLLFSNTNVLDGCISVLKKCLALKNVRFLNSKHYDQKMESYTFDQKYFSDVCGRYETQ
jgi:hypothetical protein